MWVAIEGYDYPYQVNEDGVVQRYAAGKWVDLKLQRRNNRQMHAYLKKNGHRCCVAMTTIMANAFLGGRGPGEAILHRNGSWMDNRLSNLKKTPREELYGKLGGNRRRGVVKIDRAGNEVWFYPQVKAAAKGEHCSLNAIVRRCRKELRGDEYALTGYTYRYEEDKRYA